MPYTEQGYKPKKRNPNRPSVQKGQQKGQQKPQKKQQTKQPQKPEQKGIKRTQAGNQTPAKYKQNNQVKDHHIDLKCIEKKSISEMKK